MNEPDPRLRRPVQWTRTGDGEHPYEAHVDGHWWQVRVGDFPNEPAYALLIDGAHVADVEDWLPNWTRP